MVKRSGSGPANVLRTAIIARGEMEQRLYMISGWREASRSTPRQGIISPISSKDCKLMAGCGNDALRCPKRVNGRLLSNLWFQGLSGFPLHNLSVRDFLCAGDDVLLARGRALSFCSRMEVARLADPWAGRRRERATEKCGEAVLNSDKLREGPRYATLGDDSACADHTYSGFKPRAVRRKSRERGLSASAL